MRGYLLELWWIQVYLLLAARFEVPVYLANRTSKTILSKIQIHPKPVNLQILFTKENGSLVLKAGIQAEVFYPIADKYDIIASNPAWLLTGDRMFCLANTSSVYSLPLFPIIIPEDQAEFFRENYLRQVAKTLPIQSDLIQWKDVNIVSYQKFRDSQKSKS